MEATDQFRTLSSVEYLVVYSLRGWTTHVIASFDVIWFSHVFGSSIFVYLVLDF